MAARDVGEYVAVLEQCLERGTSVWALLPREMSSGAAATVQSVTDMDFLVKRVASWGRRQLLDEFELAKLLGELGAANDSVAIEYASSLVTDDGTGAACSLISDIPFDRSFGAWLRLCEVSTSARSGVLQAFASAAGFVGGWTSNGVDEPYELRSRLELLKQLEAAPSNASVALLLREAKVRIEEELLRFRKEREAEADPR
jgi:hypothetical protein